MLLQTMLNMSAPSADVHKMAERYSPDKLALPWMMAVSDHARAIERHSKDLVLTSCDPVELLCLADLMKESRQMRRFTMTGTFCCSLQCLCLANRALGQEMLQVVCIGMHMASGHRASTRYQTLVMLSPCAVGATDGMTCLIPRLYSTLSAWCA